ncbi:MAG: hypothetical protein AAFR11_07305 [Pseudomonadota bacterium]
MSMPRPITAQAPTVTRKRRAPLAGPLLVLAAMGVWSAPARAQVAAGNAEVIKQFLGDRTPATRRRDSNMRLRIGPEYLYTTNIFLEPEDGARSVICLADGSLSPPEECPPPTAGGPAFETAPIFADLEPNEASVAAVRTNLRMELIRPSYELFGGGDVVVFQDSENDELRVTPAATLIGKTGAFRDKLVIDAAVNATRTNNNEQVISSFNEFANTENRDIATSASVSPTFTQPLSRFSGFNLRYARRQTWRFGEETDGRSSINEYGAGFYASTPDERLQFAAGYDRLRTENRLNLDGNATGRGFTFLDRESIVAEGWAAVTKTFGLIAEGGVDDVQSERLDNARLDGTFWSGGFTATGRTFNVLARYGRRFGDEYFAGDATYVFRDRLTFSARATRALEIQFGSNTLAGIDSAERLISFYDNYGRFAFSEPVIVNGQQLILNGQPFFRIPDTGLQGSLSPVSDFQNALAASSGESSEPGVTDRVNATIGYRGDTYDVTLQAGYVDFDFGDIASEVQTVSASFGKRFGRRYRAEIGVSASWSERELCILPLDTQAFCDFEFDVPEIPDDLPISDEVREDLEQSVGNNEAVFRIDQEFEIYRARAQFTARFGQRLFGLVETGYLTGGQGSGLNSTSVFLNDVEEVFARIALTWETRRR